MTANAVQRAGAFTTRRFTIPAGQERQFDCDAVQVLVTELDNAAELQLQLNGGDEGRAWKGFEARGRVLHVAARNTNPDPITVEFMLVSPGLVVSDRRLNQVGDLGLVTTYAVFQPLGTTTIPANSVRQVAAADPERRMVLLTNPPGQFREVYISGSAFTLPSAALVNGDFEASTPPAVDGWTEVGDNNWTTEAAAARTGALGVRHSLTGSDRILRQTVDLLARGFDAAAIDAGGLVAKLTGWGRRNVAAGSFAFDIEFRDAADLLISEVTTGALTPGAGVYTLAEVEGAMPALTRLLRVDIHMTNGSGTTDFDDFVLTVDGAPPGADELAGLVMPSQMVQLASSGAIYAFNPHTSDQDLLVGEIKG